VTEKGVFCSFDDGKLDIGSMEIGSRNIGDF
jgi:hypothetical protein